MPGPALDGEGRRAYRRPDHAVDDEVYDAIRGAVIRLIRSREIRPDSSARPVCFVLHDIDSEQRARDLAAALHAALHGDLEPLTHAVRAR
ncbi:hypothetical protein ACF06X_14970 [Streptomyces sp. NPDC015346]|uniref:hypothetical protein n=1 Tax=Streptomyces sp. NPDC015346 TaxID=3364954 RepID=UPI0036FED2AB